MRRAAALALAIALQATCVSRKDCREGTVLLTIELGAGAEQADRLEVSIGLDGNGLQPVDPVPHVAGQPGGTLQLDVAAFASRRSIAVEVVAWRGTERLGPAGRLDAELAGKSCLALALTVPGGGSGPETIPDASAETSGPFDAAPVAEAGGDAPGDTALDAAGDGPAADAGADHPGGDGPLDAAADLDPCSGKTCSGMVSDLCCPLGCGAAGDRDCPGCGNGRLEAGEACDPISSCPTACPSVRCQRFRLEGAQTCGARCVPDTTIAGCVPGDGCCPPTCTRNDDSDCAAVCGNSAVESTETCDPPADCLAKKATCVDDSDRIRTQVGKPEDCTFDCQVRDRPCQAGDGFCPSGCTFLQDSDCKKPAGASCGESSECGATAACIEGRCCIESCSPCQSCTGAGGTCAFIPRFSQDNFPAGTCVGGSACDGAGACKRQDGQVCGSDALLCLSASCVDGTCCNTACNGSCQRCNLPGSIGTCTTVRNATDPGTCSNGSTCNANGVCTPDAVCGNGQLTPPEACDDGNGVGGDGCSGACTVETGWSCPNPGQTCVCAGGFTYCLGKCANLQNDPQHCGICGRTCPGGAVCNGGACLTDGGAATD